MLKQLKQQGHGRNIMFNLLHHPKKIPIGDIKSPNIFKKSKMKHLYDVYFGVRFNGLTYYYDMSQAPGYVPLFDKLPIIRFFYNFEHNVHCYIDCMLS